MASTRDSLSISEARRIAIAAQQFLSPGAAPKTAKAVAEVVRRLGVVQIDSVNVLVRSHYLPIFSRRGSYSSALLERAAYDDRLLFEYWGHEASFLPIESYPLIRWRMDDARNGVGTWKGLRRFATNHQDLVGNVLAQIRDRGPLGASELTGAGKSKGSWWGWSEGKQIVEWLFWSGQVTTASRRNFERLYDLSERVLPESTASPVPARDEAQRQLMLIGARAMGVATARDLRDYFRLPAKEAVMRLAELVEQGQLLPVTVEGWKQQAYLHPEAKIPRQAKVSEVAALLSPFDSLIWERQRTERLFDFHFRLEIYTPIQKRLHGYYVLPLLMGDQIVGRLDLKSDRQNCVLQVKGGSVEKEVNPAEVAEPLARLLSELAQWLKLEKFVVTSRRGELMRALRRPR